MRLILKKLLKLSPNFVDKLFFHVNLLKGQIQAQLDFSIVVPVKYSLVLPGYTWC